MVAAGGSVVLACLTLRDALNGARTPIEVADAFYGTRFSDIQGWIQSCHIDQDTTGSPAAILISKLEPVSKSAPTPDSGKGFEERKSRDPPSKGRIYVTYTKLNPQTNRSYAGRTSMVVDLQKPLRPQALAAVNVRDANHHIDENLEPQGIGFRPALLDEFDVGASIEYANRYEDLAYWRIRGREQQLIDSLGGAQSDHPHPPRTENIQRGVAKDNPLGRLFHDAATKKWGQLHPYTGE